MWIMAISEKHRFQDLGKFCKISNSRYMAINMLGKRVPFSFRTRSAEKQTLRHIENTEVCRT